MMVDRLGIEPRTLGLRGLCSNQLSYQSLNCARIIGRYSQFVKALERVSWLTKRQTRRMVDKNAYFDMFHPVHL